MVLEDYKIDGDYIKISKAELESFRDHYCKLAKRHKGNNNSFRQALYNV